MAKLMRLDKFLTEMGHGSRTQVKELARKGRIHVNHTPCMKPETKIDPAEDLVTVDGFAVAYAAMEYYLLNKPQGVISATEDRRHETVLDLIEGRLRDDLFPVGRLDIDTEGLLLITNDGDLAHRLLTPSKHVDKVYFAKVSGVFPEDCRRQFEAGIVLEDGTQLKPAVLVIDGHEEELTLVRLTIREGKFHQVKRMFEAVGCCVEYLKRLSMGPLVLDEGLEAGSYRPLTEEEISRLKELSI